MPGGRVQCGSGAHRMTAKQREHITDVSLRNDVQSAQILRNLAARERSPQCFLRIGPWEVERNRALALNGGAISQMYFKDDSWRVGCEQIPRNEGRPGPQADT